MGNKRKVTATIISLFLAVSVIGGCAGSNSDDSKIQSTQPQGTSSQSSGTPVELSFYSYLPPSTVIKEIDDIAGIAEIAKKTNVKIKWLHPSVPTDEQQSFNLLIASGDYPDIILHRFQEFPGGVQKVMDDGLAIKLNEYLDKYAPNYKKILDQYPVARKQAMLDDGSIAGFGSIEADIERTAYAGLAIRKDWLDKAGLEVPKTIDDWYAALKAFKTKDPNGNGKEDEVPFTDQKNMSYLYSFAGAWGILVDFCLDPSSGKVVFGPAQPAFEGFLETMSKWYGEGLIDSEFASIDQKTVDAKLTQGIVGSNGTTVTVVSSLNKNMKKNIPDYNLVATPFPIGPAGKSYSTQRVTVQQTGVRFTVISSKCKNKEAALKYLDYYYSPEGMDLALWGIKGQSYTEENGVKKYTDLILNNPNGLDPVQALSKFAIPQWGWCKPFSVKTSEFLEYYTPQSKEANKVWYSGGKELLYPQLQLRSSEGGEFSRIMTEVNTYVLENAVKVITGKQQLNFDNYIKTLKGMNIDKAIQLQQQAYDRYNARK